MEITLALFIVLGATVVILNLGRFSERSPLSVSGLTYINIQLKYQLLLLGVAILYCSLSMLSTKPIFLPFLFQAISWHPPEALRGWESRKVSHGLALEPT